MYEDDDDKWNDNPWGDSSRVSDHEGESEIKAQITVLKSEKTQLQAQIAELEEDIHYQNRLYSLGMLFNTQKPGNSSLHNTPETRSKANNLSRISQIVSNLRENTTQKSHER